MLENILMVSLLKKDAEHFTVPHKNIIICQAALSNFKHTHFAIIEFALGIIKCYLKGFYFLRR